MREETNYAANVLEFLTDDEKQKFEEHYMEWWAEHEGCSGCYCYAYNSIKAPHGKELTFEAFIEDDGACIDLKTPYDERDGKFSALDGFEFDRA